MKEYTIKLSTIEDVRNFVNAVTSCEYDVDLASGRYVVDAKSIMGIFSLDLMNPIQMTVHGENTADFEKKVEAFLVK
ncbi:MAG: HPr family phosphocarrier protein [Clostridia bacterium]|nr:HPr family phosphocarrier protein [Clostridia bacterium]